MLNIVVIEDEEPVRENICILLENEGYRAIPAGSGLSGMQHICEVVPSLVICDINMPGLNGYQVLRILRLDRRLSKIPFIFLTALSDKSNVRKGMELGADDYVTKPFSRQELLKAIQTRLSRQSAFEDNTVGIDSITISEGSWQVKQPLAPSSQPTPDPFYRFWLEIALGSYPADSLEKRLFRGEIVAYDELTEKIEEVEKKFNANPDEDLNLILHWLKLERWLKLRAN